MAVMFKSRTLHGRLELLPGVALAFEDVDAEPYFVAAGFADETAEEPTYTYPEGSVEIDPQTVHAESGDLVMEG